MLFLFLTLNSRSGLGEPICRKSTLPHTTLDRDGFFVSAIQRREVRRMAVLELQPVQVRGMSLTGNGRIAKKPKLQPIQVWEMKGGDWDGEETEREREIRYF